MSRRCRRAASRGLRGLRPFGPVGSHGRAIPAALLLVLSVGVSALPLRAAPASALAGSGAVASTDMPTFRDKLLWPFDRHSIWNMPIGSSAQFADPHFAQPPNGYGIDEEPISMSSSGPLRTVYSHPWPAECYKQGDTNTGIQLPVADNLTVGPNRWDGNTPNLAGGVLGRDGRTIQEFNYLSRCSAGGPISVGSDGIRGTLDIYGDGRGTGTQNWGGHGGSMLSGVGGSIRRGELTGPNPIRHALKLTADMGRYGKRVGGSNYFQWPAYTADANSSATYGVNARGYTPILGMGSLLAIPTTVDLSRLGLQTPEAMKLGFALQNYGMYVVDNGGNNSGWGQQSLNVEWGVHQEMQFAGVEMDTYAPNGFANTPWDRDMNRLFSQLREVINQDATHIGGGGTPVQPLAPRLSN